MSLTTASHHQHALAPVTVAALVGVSKRYRDTQVLDNVNLNVQDGEIVLITGPSGTGKSTILRLLMGLESPDAGQAWLLGERIDRLVGRHRSALLRQVGIGFQDPLLDGARTVLENLTGIGRVNGRFNDHNPDHVRLLAEIVEGFGLAGLVQRQAAVLSGGQKLRVALGRALVARPRILLLDEPTHMVDTAGKAAIYRQLEALIRAAGIAAVIVSHDDESRSICDREVDITGRTTVSNTTDQTAATGDQRGESEPFLLGTVALGPNRDASAHGIAVHRQPLAIRVAYVEDPYLAVWTLSDREQVLALESLADNHARERRQVGRWERNPGTSYSFDDGSSGEPSSSGWGDPVASAQFFRQLESPGVEAWRTLVPSAKALLYLSDPWYFQNVQTDTGLVEIDATARRMFSLVSDAVGIRSRAAVMAHIVRDICTSSRSLLAEPLRWMSIACGTALPAMKASVQANLSPKLLLVDYDKEALGHAEELARIVGFTGEIHTMRLNIFDFDAMIALGSDLASRGQSPDLIDLMGIFEYTGLNLGVDPVKFLASAWQALAPGGNMILGQMLTGRPLPDFTMGVVQWPYVEMRTLDELLDITTAAGLPPELTEVYLPSDGVYAVLRSTKPL